MSRPRLILLAALAFATPWSIGACSRHTTAPAAPFGPGGASVDLADHGLPAWSVQPLGRPGASRNDASYGLRVLRRRPLRGAPAAVPAVRDLRCDVHGGTITIRGDLSGPPGRSPAYDPFTAGGWMMQVFVNADQLDTGYWMGFDYIVRGGEMLNDHEVVVRRIAPSDDFPGGWGPESGEARLAVHDHSFQLDIPRASLGGDDGRVDFLVETYATVACPGCDGGVTQVLGSDYVGTTVRVMPAGRGR